MITINSYFDKVFYINMDSDTDRSQSMIKQFKKFDIENYERIEGCRIIDLPPINEYRNFNSFDRNYVLGSLGCRNSHLQIVEISKKREYKKILIFEDDAIITQDLNKVLSSNEAIFNDWDMLYFGGLIENFFRNQIVCLHAYALSHVVYDDIINMAIPSGMEIDNFYAKILQHMSYNYNQSGKYNVRTIEPFNCVIQNHNFKSNIK